MISSNQVLFPIKTRRFLGGFEMKKSLKNKAIALFLLATLVTSSISPAFGAVIAQVAKDDQGNQFEYPYAALSLSYAAFLQGDTVGAALFNDYSSKTVCAFKDSVRGYVDYNYVRDVYVSSPTDFDIDTATESPNATPATMPATIKQVNIVNGELAFVDIQTQSDIKTFTVYDGITLGKKMVIVELNASDSENYNVSVAGVELDYNPTTKKFSGEVATSDAVVSKVVVTEKAVGTMPAVKTFSAFDGITIGKKVVIVELDTPDPENYNVAVAGVTLIYNSNTNKFSAEVKSADALESNVVVTEKAVVMIPTVKTFSVYDGISIGKKVVIVELDTTDPENYNVTVAGINMIYNANTKLFSVEIPRDDALESNVVVSVK